MKAEKQHKVLQAGLIQPKRDGSKLSFVDNRPEMANQTKLIKSFQRKEYEKVLPNNMELGINQSDFTPKAYCNLNKHTNAIQRDIKYKGSSLDEENAISLAAECMPLTSYMKQTVSEMVSSSEEILITDAKDLIAKIKHKNVEKLGITEDELSAINAYQGSSYKVINQALRTHNLRDIDRRLEDISNLITILQKLPKYPFKTYRMVSFDTEEQQDNFVSNCEKTFQFDSSKSLAGGSVLLGEKTFKVNMTINANSFGSDIASVISTTPDFEHEVLFPPGTKYQKKSESKSGVNYNLELDAVGNDQVIIERLMTLKPNVRTLLSKDLFHSGKDEKPSVKYLKGDI